MIVPGSPNPLLWGGGDPIDDKGVIARSVRFNAPDTPYFWRTVAAGANRKKGAISLWMKPTKIATASISNNGNMHLFMAHNGTNVAGASMTAYSRLALVGDDTNAQSRLQWHSSGSAGEAFTSNQFFRDLTAHGHLYVRWDSTVPMLEAYWNGTEISYASRTLPTLNADTMMGLAASIMVLGMFTTADPRHFDGYLSAPHVILGNAPPVTDFGLFHPKTGQWRPKRYSGTFGAYDSFMDFADGSAATASALGKDRSGNNNDWTPGNISVAAGSGQDWLPDTPTNNYCILNPLANAQNAPTNGGLEVSGSATGAIHGTLIVPRDFPVYWEVENATLNNSNLAIGVGVVRTNVPVSANYQIAGTQGIAGYYASNGPYVMKDNGTSQALGVATTAAGDVMQVAINGNNGWIGRNDVWFDSAGGTTGNPATGANPTFTISSAFDYVPFVHVYANSAKANFGQLAWSKTCPVGFYAPNLKKRSYPRVQNAKKHFDVVTRSGTSAVFTKTGLAFQLGLLWAKSRNVASEHRLFDVLRGLAGVKNKELASSNTLAEGGNTSCAVTATADGYTFSDGSSTWEPNATGSNYVDKCWKAGDSTVTNNVGTIASQVSANQAAGIAVVSWNGTGVAGTIGHGLLDTPKMIVVRNRNNTGGAAGYCVGHSALNRNSSPWNYFLQLWTIAGSQASALPWNNTAPDSSKFSVGTDLGTNYNGAAYVAYVFAEVAGFSKFGDFQGNSSADGAFVNCGFCPKYLLLKDTAGTSFWFEWDSTREQYNQMGKVLSANNNNIETAGTAYNVDFAANGFKFRWGGGDPNQSGHTYVFAAFAEFPGRYANAK